MAEAGCEQKINTAGTPSRRSGKQRQGSSRRVSRPGDRPWGTADRSSWTTAYIPDLKWRVQVRAPAKRTDTLLAACKRSSVVTLRKVSPDQFAKASALGPRRVMNIGPVKENVEWWPAAGEDVVLRLKLGEWGTFC